MNTQICLSPNGVDTYRTLTAPSSLLVGTMDGVVELRASPRTDRWERVNRSLDGLHVGSLMCEPGRGAIFAGVHGEGLYRSLDGGNGWETGMPGLTVPHVFTLAYDRRGDSVTLYAGTEPVHLFRSRNGGDSWTEVTGLKHVPGQDKWWFPATPHIAHVKHVATDPRDERVLYVCVEQGALLKSWDGGEHFEQLLFEDAGCRYNNDTHRIVFNPQNSDEIYLDGGDGIFRSADAGRSWEHVATPAMRVAYPDHLFIAPDDPNTIFAVGGGDPPNIWRTSGDARSTIVRSPDCGRHWSQVGGELLSSLPGNLEAATLVSWPDGYGFFAGSTDGEVFCSLDRGEHWSRIADSLPPVSKCIHYGNLAKGRAVAASAQKGL
jgi:photosystem II stability/assembly factor-like uncharacterized protein